MVSKDIITRELTLLKLDDIGNDVLDNLISDLLNIFKDIFHNIRVIEDSNGILKKYNYKYRKKFDAVLLIDDVQKVGKQNNCFRILGVTKEDLRTKLLQFVFGVAFNPMELKFSEKGSALISLKRLDEQYYNYPNNPELFRLRILKEAVHELGHTFGLQHCKNKCVMRFSNRIGETDNKPAKFCDECTEKIRGAYKLK